MPIAEWGRSPAHLSVGAISIAKMIMELYLEASSAITTCMLLIRMHRAALPGRTRLAKQAGLIILPLMLPNEVVFVNRQGAMSIVTWSLPSLPLLITHRSFAHLSFVKGIVPISVSMCPTTANIVLISPSSRIVKRLRLLKLICAHSEVTNSH